MRGVVSSAHDPFVIPCLLLPVSCFLVYIAASSPPHRSQYHSVG